MPDLIIKKTNDIWTLQQKVDKSSENILPQINLDDLLKNPRKYLTKFSQSFLAEHLDEIEEGAKIGEKFAEDVLIETKNREA